MVRKLLEQKAVDELLSSNNLSDLAKGQPTSYAQAMVLAMIKKALEGDIRAVGGFTERQDKSYITDDETGFFNKPRLVIEVVKIIYAINHMHNIAKQWLDADYDLRVRFQTMLFPQGTTFNMTTMHFGTEKISPLYRYAANKKDLSEPEKSSLVTHIRGTWKTVIEDLIRLSELLVDDEEADHD